MNAEMIPASTHNQYCEQKYEPEDQWSCKRSPEIWDIYQ